MATSIADTKTINAVIISSYVYDHPNTDMACAWSTVYKMFNIDTREIFYLEVGTGWGQTIPEQYNIVKLTDEIKLDFKKKEEDDKLAKMKSDFDRFQQELDEYNEKRLPQSKGQVVEIISGRSKGKVGKITWMGHSKFGSSSSSSYSSVRAAVLAQVANYRPYTIPGAEFDLILVRPVDGAAWEDGKDKVYIDPKKCKVVEGYVDVKLDEKAMYEYGRIFDDLHRKRHMGYNFESYV